MQPGAFLQDIDFQFFAILHQPGAEFLPLLEYKTNTIVSYTKDCVQKSHPHLEILASNLGLPVLQPLLQNILLLFRFDSIMIILLRVYV